MRLVKRIILVLVLFHSVNFFYSCGSNYYDIYNITDFNLTHYDLGAWSLISEGSEANPENYSIIINFDTEKTDTKYVINYQGGNMALAGDPQALMPELENEITKVEIISDAHFNDEHPAGSALNDYFESYILNRSMYERGDAFGECADSLNNYCATLEEAFNEFSLHDYPYSAYWSYNLIILKARPDNPGAYRFSINIEFKDGSSMKRTTEPVKFK